MLINIVRALIWGHVVYGYMPALSDQYSYLFRGHSPSNCTNPLDFECVTGGSCIKRAQVCDDEIDCADKSDESNCDYLKCEPPKWFLCRDSQLCLNSASRCDGSFDCPKNDDEQNCEAHVAHHEVTKCPDDEFTCSADGLCLPKDHWCDGQLQCIDGSDEKDCEQRSSVENSNEFVCKNQHRLTNLKWVCDGEDDCGDGSDEHDCPSNCTISNSRYLCKDNRTCVDAAKVCNRIPDCPDASDENGDCLKFAGNKDCPPNACPHNVDCFIFPAGPVCRCPSGFEYDANTHLCEDINECEQFGRCSQGCINTLGAYRCTCIASFVLGSDRKSCDANNNTDALLLYATKASISGVWMDRSSQHQFVVTEKTRQVIGVSYDGRFVYWTDIGANSESIVKSREDGSEMEVILTAGLSAPEDIAVDWLTGNLYFTDKNLMHVAVCSNDGRHCVALVNEDVHMPRNIVLLPQQGRMFWSDWGDRPMIATSLMDGTRAQPFVSEKIYWPNGVALDWPNERLYWVDAKLKTIESIRFDGHDRRVAIEGVLKHPYGVAIFENHIYWSDWATKSIQRCNKFNCKDRDVVTKDKLIYDIHIYHTAMQPKQANPCENHTCSHLCLLTGNSTFVCACPSHMKLAEDKRSCTEQFKRQLLLVGIGNTILNIEHRTFGRQEASDVKHLKMHIDKMTLNTLTGAVIIADNRQRAIYSVDIWSTRTKDLVTQHIGRVSAICFDELGNNILWTDEERGTIEVLSLRTNGRAIIHHYMGFEYPIALAVIPENGQLLVALHSKYGHAHLTRIPMHGRGPFHHIVDARIGNGDIQFTIDKELKYIYWLDDDYQTISFTDYDGNMNHTFVTNIDGPNSMAVLDDDIFWTTIHSTVLHWAPKHNPENAKTLMITPPEFMLSLDHMHILAVTPAVRVDHACQPSDSNQAPCSHICVPLGIQAYGCVCPIGMVFKNTQNVTCIEATDCDFRCLSGECLAQSRKCDGRKDCSDGFDEHDCDQRGHVTSCSSDQFKCIDGSKCVPKEHRCDLNNDCPDHSDELECEHLNKTTGCRKRQFKCPDNICIDTFALCDGFNDCAGGEDELNCNTTSAKTELCKSSGMFLCTSGECIEHTWKCDGLSDCRDGSDEHNCPRLVCPRNFFQCYLGQCIDPKLVCDGINHCGDNSDELCTEQKHLHVVCGEEDFESIEPKKFQCTSNRSMCLDIRVRCNGTAECPRGEDEADCKTCRIDEFECANQNCIPREWHCDNSRDCYDGSDEVNCNVSLTITAHNHRCLDHEFDCKDGSCVDLSTVCNGHNDCANGLDESGSCDADCTPGLCQHTCKRTPYGPVCSCQDGFVLAADKQKCYDLDECREFSPCAQECTNTEGSFRCSCFTGYMLRSDKTSCKTLTRDKFMLYNSFDRIYNITSNTIQVLWSSNDSRITGMDLNMAEHRLYFTLHDSSSLFEYNLQSNVIRYINKIGSPRKVSVDWITNNVYVVDELAEHTIKVCHMDEKLCINLLHFSFLDAIGALAVDPVNNRLFYTIVQYAIFSSPRSMVYSHALDGTGMVVLVNVAGHISDVVCDPNKQLLFYAELSSASIWSVKYDGTDKRPLISTQKGVTRPISIMLAQDELYIINAGSRDAAHCKVYADRECKIFDIMAYNTDNLVSSHEPSQKLVRNVCAGHNCTFSLCVAAHRGPKCLCSGGKFVPPGERCKEILQSHSGILSSSKESARTSSNVAGIVLGFLCGLLVLAAVLLGLYWMKRRHLSHRRFFSVQMCDATTFATEDDDKNCIYDDNTMTTRLIRHTSN